MDYYTDKREISEAVKHELDAMFHKHQEADRGYEEENRYKTFELHWEPKRIVINELQEQLNVYVVGKRYESFNVVLSRMDDKGRSHVKQAYSECKDIIMQDLGDRSEYKLFTGRISNHYSQELRMRETEMEFVYCKTPANVELIQLWCGGIISIWRRQDQKGHFKQENI